MEDKDTDILEEKARAVEVDVWRVRVWSAMADLYLEYDWSAEHVYEKAVILGRSPFSIRELFHILYHEVSPFCLPHFYGGSRGNFLSINIDELIRSCKLSYELTPFDDQKDPDKVPFQCHLILGKGPSSRAYSVLLRVQKMRQHENQ
ncbi:MAG: hypothetical protein KC777_11515 [Cyanobacteria bacterium HKST-UBA02]|nr:hypothetical protein [Cyanobacteria bacterium HKST-UBA02]